MHQNAFAIGLCSGSRWVKLAFHGADTDTYTDILARMSVSVSVSVSVSMSVSASWNASLRLQRSFKSNSWIFMDGRG